MRKISSFILAVVVCMTALTGCNSAPKDPGPPPSDVINNSGSSAGNSNSNNSSTGNSTSDSINNSTGNGSQSTDSASQSTDSTSQSTDSTPQSTDTSSQSTGSTPQGTSSSPQSTGSVPQSTGSTPQGSSSTQQSSSSIPQNTYSWEVLQNAVSVRIGNFGRKDWYINMYDNAAARTMLGYLSSSEMRFPTYNYDGEHGFVSQSVRGSYTRNDEVTVADVKAGELYLLSGGQLRFYFKDSKGVNINATPIGYYVETDGLADAVVDAYTSNLGDPWGVDVYFNIRKTN